jgi:very-short-patch-repair endonuclease
VPASGLERRYRDLCAAAGLPRPEINRYLLLGDEYHRVDFLWRRERVVIETDGDRYHSTGWQRRRDARRDEALSRHGFRHARVAEEVIEHDAARAVAIAAVLVRGC